MPALLFYPSAQNELARLNADAGLAGRLRAVNKALGHLQLNPRHPALNSHKYKGRTCPHGHDLFEAYAENNRPSAYRIFYCYSPDQADTILVHDITQHP